MKTEHVPSIGQETSPYLTSILDFLSSRTVRKKTSTVYKLPKIAIWYSGIHELRPQLMKKGPSKRVTLIPRGP